MKSLIPKLVLVTMLGACASCIERPKVEADLWKLVQLPEALCPSDSPLWNYGPKRTINCIPEKEKSGLCKIDNTCGTDKPNKNCFYIEWISYCDKKVADHLSMDKADVSKWLDQIAPAPVTP